MGHCPQRPQLSTKVNKTTHIDLKGGDSSILAFETLL